MTDPSPPLPRRRYTTLPRKPQRKNGREKFDTLLDALDGLLQFRETSEISLSDLSEAAGVPAASVYHFFPNREALFAALMQRHLDSLPDVTVGSSPNWQSRTEHFLDQLQQQLCASESVMKLRFGPAPGWAVRELLLEDRNRLGLRLLDYLDTDFELPASTHWPERFRVALTIAEGIWSGAYGRFGRIDDFNIGEAKRAAIAYLGYFFGERLPLRIREEEEALLD